MRFRQRGSAFVVTLAVLAGLVAVLASLTASYRAAVKAQIGRQERARARMAAESGVQRALAVLADVPSANPTATTQTTSTSTTTGNGTTLQDDWAELGSNGDEKFVVGRESFRIQIVDAASRININTAPQTQLQLLPLTTEQIESLLDFRETGQTPRSQGGKDEYYNNLPNDYNTKLRALDSLDEILQVRGWTARDLYEPITNVTSNTPLPEDQNGDPLPLAELLTTESASPEVDPTGQAKINVNAAGNAQRLQTAGLSQPAVQVISSRTNWANIGEVVAAVPQGDQQRVLDYLTTTSAPRTLGLININTAPQELLATVPGITTDIAQAIVQRQSQGFASLGELASVSGVSTQILQQAAPYLTAISQSFIVRVVGTAGDSKVALEAIVDVADGTPRIRKIFEVPYTNPETRWKWNEDTTTETVLKEAS